MTKRSNPEYRNKFKPKFLKFKPITIPEITAISGKKSGTELFFILNSY